LAPFRCGALIEVKFNHRIVGFDPMVERAKNGMKNRGDPEGTVRYIIRNINPKGHAREVFELMKEIN